MFKICILIFLGMQSLTHAKTVRVAFLESHDAHGKPIELHSKAQGPPNYFHVAVQVEGIWFHSAPYEGATYVDSLTNLDPSLKVKVILEKKGVDTRLNNVAPYLGLPFDYDFHWSCEESTYCSKFVAQVLNIPPTVMNFDSEFWKYSPDINRGDLGISPAKIYEELIQRGFYKVSPYKNMRSPYLYQCEALLN